MVFTLSSLSPVAQINRYKIVLVGAPCSGKTTFVHSLCGLVHSETYTPTLGVDIHSFSCSSYTAVIWDCAGKEDCGGLRDGYWMNTDGAIIYLDGSQDLDTQTAYLEEYNTRLNTACPGIPIVIVVGKVIEENLSVDDFFDVFYINNPRTEAPHTLRAPVEHLISQI